MKRLKDGFTLIELLIVIAIIGILTTTLAPKLRKQLAKAKDAKAIALLGSARTATEIILLEKATVGDINKKGYILISLEEIKDKLDERSNKIFEKNKDGNILVGNILDKDDKIRDDWKIYFFGRNDKNGKDIKLKINNKLKINDDEVQLKLMVGNSNNKKKAKSTEGKEWIKY